MAALSGILYGILPAIIQLTYDRGVGLFEAMFWRFAAAAALCLPVLRYRKISFRVSRQQLAELILVGAAGSAMTSILLNWSYTLIDAGLATVCHFIYPIVVVLIMRLLFGERIGRGRLVAVLVYLGGLYFLWKSAGNGELRGILVAAASGVVYALYVTAQQKAHFVTLEKPLILFWLSAVSAGVALLCALRQGGISLSRAVPCAGYLLAAAAIISGGMLLQITGIRYVGASTAAFLSLLEPVTSILVDLGLFGILPSAGRMTGMGLILVSILLVSLAGRPEPEPAPDRAELTAPSKEVG